MSSGHGRSTHIAALSPALEQASFMIYRMVVCDAQPREALLSKLGRDLLIADPERQRRTGRRRRSPNFFATSLPCFARALS